MRDREWALMMRDRWRTQCFMGIVNKYIVCGLREEEKISHSIWFWVFALYDKWRYYLQAWSVCAVVANARCSSKRLTIDTYSFLFYVKRPWDRIKNPIVFLALCFFVLSVSMHRILNINYGHLFSLLFSRFIYHFWFRWDQKHMQRETDFVSMTNAYFR